MRSVSAGTRPQAERGSNWCKPLIPSILFQNGSLPSAFQHTCPTESRKYESISQAKSNLCCHLTWVALLGHGLPSAYFSCPIGPRPSLLWLLGRLFMKPADVTMEIHRLQWRASQAHFDSCFFPPSKEGLQGLGVGCQLGPRFFFFLMRSRNGLPSGAAERAGGGMPMQNKGPQPSALCGNVDRDNEGSLSRAHERCPVRLPFSPGTLPFILLLLTLKRKNSPVGSGELTWTSRIQAAF